MTAKSYFRGHEVYYDFNKQEWIYTDDNTIATENIRPCKRCGNLPTSKRHDYCLGDLGENVTSACCGHGIRKGFILFEDGRLFEELEEEHLE